MVKAKAKVKSKKFKKPGVGSKSVKKCAKKPAQKKSSMPKKIKMKKMLKSDLAKFKELLIKERSLVGGDLSHIAQNALNKSQRDATGSLSGYSYHMADMASDDYDRDFSLDRATEEQKILYLIDEAIKRVDEGTYGACLECGGEVSKKRLAALPHTKYCIECQKKLESK